MNNKHFIGKNVLRQKTNICCFVDLLSFIGVNSFLSFTFSTLVLVQLRVEDLNNPMCGILGSLHFAQHP